MPYTLISSIFRRLHSGSVYIPRSSYVAFHILCVLGVGESKKVSLPDSLVVVCARLDGILSRVVTSALFESARSPLLITSYLVGVAYGSCYASVGRPPAAVDAATLFGCADVDDITPL